jgi:hypothetical protein
MTGESASGTVALVTCESHREVTAGGFYVHLTAWHTPLYEKHYDKWQQVWGPGNCRRRPLAEP